MTDAHHLWLGGKPRMQAARRRVARSGAAAMLGALLLALATLAGCGEQAGAWRLIGPDGGARAYTVVADPHVAGLIYAGGDDGGVYRGRVDQPSGRVASGDGIPQATAVGSVLPDPLHVGVVFAGTSRGFYRSDHYGDHWSAYGAGLPSGKTAVALAATPDDATLLAGIDHGGLYRSLTDGATWVASDSGLPAQATPVALTWDARDHLWLLGLVDVSGAALYASSDGGQTWVAHAAALPAGAQVNALATLGGAGDAPLTAFAATTQGLYRSADAGQSWSPVGGGLPQGSALALATLTQQPTWVYVSIGAAVYRSTDGGAQWQSVAPGLTTAAQGLAVTEGKTSGPVVYVAAGQVARYPAGVTPSNSIPSGLALVVIVLALIVGGYVVSRRMRRFGYAMGVLRNERNTGRAADEAERLSGARGAPTASGPPTRATESQRAEAEQPGEGRVIAPTEMTSRATTGVPADEDKATQNGHGQPRARG